MSEPATITPETQKRNGSSTTATTTSTSNATSGVPRKVARLPTLNQLAARMTSNASAKGDNNNIQPNMTTSSTLTRPRLAAFGALRTGSQTSVLSTAMSTADSMAVNPPSTRSVSPAMSSTSQQSGSVVTTSGGPIQDCGIAGGEPLTLEKVERFNQETTIAEEGTADSLPLQASLESSSVPKKRVGYKNIPSLDVITARMAKQRAMSLSVDGSANPPEPEMIEDPKSPGVPIKAPEHPLQFSWTIYHDTKTAVAYTPRSSGLPTAAPEQPPYSVQAPDGQDYEAGLTIIGEFNTVEEFCRYFNWLKPPSKLEKNSNYHLFKSGIKPMWEDPANANGGKWVLTMKNSPALLDRCWNWLAFALVGEELEEGDEICGAVVSLRSKVDRIQVWTRGKEDVEKINSMGKRLVKLLDVSESDNIGLEFQYNSEDRPPLNKFLSIQAIPTSSFRPTFQTPSTGPGSASAAGPPRSITGDTFGGFGTGVGIGGWKGAKKA